MKREMEIKMKIGNLLEAIGGGCKAMVGLYDEEAMRPEGDSDDVSANGMRRITIPTSLGDAVAYVKS